jgi:von Willebrand factor type A domain-containing protein/glucodextranase-like protein
MKYLSMVVGLLFAVAIAGCSTEKSSCVAGAVQYCPCAGGMMGAQMCNTSGDAWGGCQCQSTGNDALSNALTGHDSSESTSSENITISGSTPDGRGDAGNISISNSESPEGSESIGISVGDDGSYSETISLSKGENEITVSILEAQTVIIEATVVITYTPEGDSDSDTDGDSFIDAGAPDADGDVDSDTGESDLDIDSDADSDADPGADAGGDLDTDSDTGYTCNEQNFSIIVEPNRVMLLLDSSGSMGEQWSVLTTALGNSIPNYEDSTEFGVDIFPSGAACLVGSSVSIDAAPSNYSTIAAFLGTALQTGSTPLHCALSNFIEPLYAPSFEADEQSAYLVVVTDGGDSCGTDCLETTPASATEMGMVAADLLTLGVKTIAIGFGGGVDAAQLNALSANGGTSLSSYLAATDVTTLTAVLDTVFTMADASCTFTIDDPAAITDPDLVNFYFDDVLIGADPGCAVGDGWDWTDESNTAIIFCPNACDNLTSGSVSSINATLGCPTIFL